MLGCLMAQSNCHVKLTITWTFAPCYVPGLELHTQWALGPALLNRSMNKRTRESPLGSAKRCTDTGYDFRFGPSYETREQMVIKY